MKKTPYYWNAKQERFSATRPTGIESPFYINNIVKIYFDCAYILCISPFKLVVVNKCFQPRTWKPQQACCILMHLITFLHLGFELVIAIKDKDAPESVYALAVLGNAFFMAYLSYSVLGFWRQKDIYAELVETSIQSSVALRRNQNRMKYPIFVKGFMMLVTVIKVFTGTFKCLPSIFHSVRSWVLCHSDDTLHLGFSNNTDPNFPHTQDIVVASILTTSQLVKLLTYVISDLGILVLVVSMWTVADDYKHYCDQLFSKEMTRTTAINTKLFQRVLDALVVVQSFSAVVNITLSHKLALYLMDASLYYPMQFKSLFLPGSNNFRLHFMIGFISVCVILALAANVKTKVVSSTENVVIEAYKIGLRPDSLQLLQMEMFRNTISVCCNNAVEVSVGFVGNIYVLFITLFVISTTTANKD